MYHIFFINPSVDGHLWYFYVLAIAKNVAMKTGVHVFFFESRFVWIYAQV